MSNVSRLIFANMRKEDSETYSFQYAPSWWGNQEIDVRIDSPTFPSELMQEKISRMLDLDKNFYREFERELFEYYAQEIYGSIGGLGEDENDTEEYTPTLKDPSDVWKLLSSFQIYFMDGFADSDDLSISMECFWDPEHGFEVSVEDGKVAGFGGVCSTSPITDESYKQGLSFTANMFKDIFDDKALEKIISKSPNLKMLALSDCRLLTDRSLSKVGELQNLSRLYLDGCSGLTEKGLCNLVETLSSIEDISFRKLEVATNELVEECSRKATIKELFLDNCSSLTNECVGHLRNFKSLRWLGTEGCRNISEIKPEDLPPSLEYLRVSGSGLEWRLINKIISKTSITVHPNSRKLFYQLTSELN